MKRITVFTPTYNRGYIIENLYKSLKRQDFVDFEWIVVDDGSTDNTKDLFERILEDDKNFSIIYERTENGGKHRAINRGLQLASGELFFIVDSDDYLTDDALRLVDDMEKSIPESEKRKSFAGVCALKGYSETELIGTTFSGDILDITILERTKYGIEGDKAEVFYTDILRKYPFPEFEGENFLTECIVWDRMAYDGFKLRFFNKICYIADYLEDGLSAKYHKLMDNNPKSKGLYLYQCGLYGKLFGLKKWNEYYKYYQDYRDKFKFGEIAKNLHINPVVLFFRFLGMKIFYKLYDAK